MQFNFDAAQVPQIEPMENIPPDWYPMQVVESDIKATKDNTGKFLALSLEVLQGPFQGRKVFTNLNIENQNVKAMEIAYRSLSTICHAIGVIQMTDTSQLHGRPLMVKVGIESQEGREPRNKVTGYKAMEAQQVTPPVPPVVPPVVTPAPVPPPTPPAAAPTTSAQPAWLTPVTPPAATPPAATPPATPATVGAVPPWMQPTGR